VVAAVEYATIQRFSAFLVMSLVGLG